MRERRKKKHIRRRPHRRAGSVRPPIAARSPHHTAALERAMAKPGAAAAFEKIKKLKERRSKEHQSGGKKLDIFGLFEGALGAIGELWAYGLEVREASGERDAGLSWGIKKALRIWYKACTRCSGGPVDEKLWYHHQT